MQKRLTSLFNVHNWTLFELVWLALFVCAGTVVTVFTKDSLFNYAILLTGIFCVVLAAKGNIWTYAFGLFNSLGYAYVAFTNGLYGDMGLNILFFVPTNIIGFVLWRRHQAINAVAMRGLNIIQLGFILIACATLIGILGFALSNIKTQNTPYIDATSTILSIAATLLMILRYKEQWVLYIVLNIVTIVMWLIRHLSGSADGAIMMLMWSAFLINSIYGYFVWRKGAMLASKVEPIV
ncbi:MAG TPA: nicotinamide riboside transporter PnuC [Cellvibrionaceae bacterium]